MVIHTIDKWNNVSKDNESDDIAVDNDIIVEIDDVLFLCQRTNNYNNIICIALNEDRTIKHIRAMFKFIIMLKSFYNIEFIRIEGNQKRYKFLEKIFEKTEVIRDTTILDRNVYYCRLTEKAINILQSLI